MHGRALLGLRPARRVLADDLALRLRVTSRSSSPWRSPCRAAPSAAAAWLAPTTSGTETFLPPLSSSTAPTISAATANTASSHHHQRDGSSSTGASGSATATGAEWRRGRRRDRRELRRRHLLALQRGDERVGVGVALRRVLGQRAHDHGLERRRHGRVELRGRHRLLGDLLERDRHRALPLERHAAGQHLVEDDPDRVDVGRAR